VPSRVRLDRPGSVRLREGDPMTFWTEALACLCWLVYGSFFEWFIHRHLMHYRRIPFQDAFRGHTLVHHQLYRWDGSFSFEGTGRPQNIMMRWYAFPLMLSFHLPIAALFQALTGWPTLWGAVAGMMLYFGGYEYTHYLMHAPRGHFVERFRWFRFLREHHRLHHRYMLRNLNVFIPLADLCLGTLVTSSGRHSKPAKRQRLQARRKQAEPELTDATTTGERVR
jgi:hypothetical protein